MSTTVNRLLHPIEHHREKKEGARQPSVPLHDRNDSAMDKPREEEKRTLAQWEDHRHTLSPDEIDKDPEQKAVGHSSKVLRQEDFELIKTLGTGTFARVWLVRLKGAPQADADKVFALKILRKVDGKEAEHSVAASTDKPSDPPQASRARSKRAQCPRQGRRTPLHYHNGRQLPVHGLVIHGGMSDVHPPDRPH